MFSLLHLIFFELVINLSLPITILILQVKIEKFKKAFLLKSKKSIFITEFHWKKRKMKNPPAFYNTNNNRNNNNNSNDSIQWLDQRRRHKSESYIQSDFKRRSDQSKSEIRDPDTDSRRQSNSKSENQSRLRQGYLPHASDSKFSSYIVFHWFGQA